MKVFVNTTFTGHWPVGCSAAVVADSAVHAAIQLQKELENRGLNQSITEESMTEIKLFPPQVIILQDGNY